MSENTETSAGEALNDAQLAELQSNLGRWVEPYDIMRATFAWDLLAEVIRDRDAATKRAAEAEAALVDATEANELLRKGNRKLRTDYLDVTTELAGLRGRIAGSDQWQVRYADWKGNTAWTEPTRFEDNARGWLADYRRNNPGKPAVLLHHYETDWIEVPDA